MPLQSQWACRRVVEEGVIEEVEGWRQRGSSGVSHVAVRLRKWEEWWVSQSLNPPSRVSLM